MQKYVIAIDQSTQGTKALLLDKDGKIAAKSYLPHTQLVSDLGWVSHDPEEIYQNTLKTVRQLFSGSGIDPASAVTVGISNQRETSLIWDRTTGKPLQNAVVWQCARASGITQRKDIAAAAESVRQKTGIPLSPYFPAAKIAWLLENTPDISKENVCAGTVDSWLVYKLTGGKYHKTDYSNASRYQLLNLHTLQWDAQLCRLFGIPRECLPIITESDGYFGETDFEGLLPKPIPIRAVMGDSHAALFGQGCTAKGMTKVTYGTGSSIMMNIGHHYQESKNGLATSLAWNIDGQVSYVLEGNINYTGAVISWLQKDVQLICDPAETQSLAQKANPGDTTYLVPAFSGLGAPYWRSEASAILYGMHRTTGKAEIVKAALESIAYQVTDVLRAMEADAGIPIRQLRCDGGPTENSFLMQFQSDISGTELRIPENQELSAIGAGLLAGIAAEFFPKSFAQGLAEKSSYCPGKDDNWKTQKYTGWKKAVAASIGEERM